MRRTRDQTIPEVWQSWAKGRVQYAGMSVGRAACELREDDVPSVRRVRVPRSDSQREIRRGLFAVVRWLDACSDPEMDLAEYARRFPPCL